MIRGITLTAVTLAVAAAGLVAMMRPEVFGQTTNESQQSVLQELPAAGSPRSILEEAPLAVEGAASGNGSAILQGAAPGGQRRASPHDSPESLYAEFVAACAQEKCSRVAACLSPELQSTWAMLFVVGAMELEFDARFAVPVQKALAAHGVDPANLSADLLRTDYSVTSIEDDHRRRDQEVVSRIRDVPAMIADLEPYLRSTEQEDKSNLNISSVLSTGTFRERRFGFLRGLKVERDSATATVRVQYRGPRFAYPMEGSAPGLVFNPTPQTNWMRISFSRVEGKWYLAKFDDLDHEAAIHDAASYTPPNDANVYPAPAYLAPPPTIPPPSIRVPAGPQ